MAPRSTGTLPHPALWRRAVPARTPLQPLPPILGHRGPLLRVSWQLPATRHLHALAGGRPQHQHQQPQPHSSLMRSLSTLDPPPLPPPSPPPPPPPASASGPSRDDVDDPLSAPPTVDQLCHDLDLVVTSADAAAIFDSYIALYNAAPDKLTLDRVTSLVASLGALDPSLATVIIRDWPTLPAAANTDPTRLLDAFASSCFATAALHSAAPIDSLIGTTLAAAELCKRTHAPFSAWAALTRVALGPVTVDLDRPSRIAVARVALAAIVGTVRELQPNEMDPEAVDHWQIRAHGMAADEAWVVGEWATRRDAIMASLHEYAATATATVAGSDASSGHTDAHAPPPPTPPPAELVALVSEWTIALSRADQFDEARTFFTLSVAHDVLPTLEAAAALLHMLAWRGDVVATQALQSALFDIYGEHRAFGPSFPSADLYTPVLQACRSALTYGRFTRSPSHTAYVHRVHVIKVASDTMAEMRARNVSFSTGTHDAAITCLVYANYDDPARWPIAKAGGYLEYMLGSGARASTRAFHAVMRGVANTRESINTMDRADFVRRYMEAMQACGLPVTAETYSIAYLSQMPRKPIVNVRGRVIRTLDEIDADRDNAGIRHTHASVHALMRAYGAHLDFNRMYRLLDAMPQEFGLPRTTHSYFTVLHACSRSGAAAEYALAVVLPQMRAEGLPLTDDLAHTILGCCVMANDAAVAWDVYEQMGAQGIPVTRVAWNYLLKLSLFNKLTDKAQFVLDEMQRNRVWWDATTYYHVMTYYTRVHPRQSRVSDVFKRLQEQTHASQAWKTALGSSTLISSPTFHDDLELATQSPLTSANSSSTAATVDAPEQTQSSETPSKHQFRSASETAMSTYLRNRTPAVAASVRTGDLTLPPNLNLPLPTVPVEQQPVSVLTDSRLMLKALQSYVAERDIDRAFSAFCAILCGFHVAVLHRFAASREYRAEAVAELRSRGPGGGSAASAGTTDANKSSSNTNEEPNSMHHGTAEELGTDALTPALLMRSPILSFPPRIVHYNPWNSRAGALYLPKDMATATWLMCTALLEVPGDVVYPQFPPLRYVYLQKEEEARVRRAREVAAGTSAMIPWPEMSPAQQYLARIKYRELPLGGRSKLAIARVVFRSAIRTLKSYLGFQTLVRFEWIKDLLGRLRFDAAYTDRFRIRVHERRPTEDRSVGPLTSPLAPIRTTAGTGSPTATTDALRHARAEPPVPLDGSPEAQLSVAAHRDRAAAASGASEPVEYQREASMYLRDVVARANEPGLDLRGRAGGLEDEAVEQELRMRKAAWMVNKSLGISAGVSQEMQPASVRMGELVDLAAALGVQLADPMRTFDRLPYSRAQSVDLESTMHFSQGLRAELPDTWRQPYRPSAVPPSSSSWADQEAGPSEPRPVLDLGSAVESPPPNSASTSVDVDEAYLEAALALDDDGMDEMRAAERSPYPPRTTRAKRRLAEEAGPPIDL
ncbi:hypothetical protein BC828DRAFT_409373 [Blastocladiella britannica]|nr:hypothetical protein BC828DRAFT_409373 [Blastocladiella britannica]